MAHAATHRHIKPSPLLDKPRQTRPGMPDPSGGAIYLALMCVVLLGLMAGAVTWIGH
jgi:hypothetical protein